MLETQSKRPDPFDVLTPLMFSTATIDRRANVLLRCASFGMRHAASAKAVFSIHRQHTLCFAPVRCCAIPASCACSIDHCEEKISRRRNNAHAIFKITRRGMTYARWTKLLPELWVDCVLNFRKWFRSSGGRPKSMDAAAETRGHNRAISKTLVNSNSRS